MATHISLALVFVEGLVSFLSPCVLPIIPIYMGYLAGNSNEKRNSNKKVLLFTISFIFGILLAIFLMNASINLLQSFLKEHMTLFVRIGGILIVLLGIYQLGFIKINFLQRTFRFSLKTDNKMNVMVAFIMGFTFSFAWTPCIGPALSSILLLAASSGDFWYSNFLMIIYAFGFTLPFLVLELFTNKALNWLNSHRDIVKYTTKIGAVILIIFGLMMFSGKLNTISNYMSPSQGQVSTNQAENSDDSVNYGNALLNQDDKPISLADYHGKVVFLNFWATWCPPCQREMPEIQKLSEKYQNSEDIAILTVVMPGGQEMDAAGIKKFLKEKGFTMPVIFDDGRLSSSFQITSLPTTYMFDRDGNVYGSVVGQLSSDMMENIIDRTLKGK
ncbi:redoxin domain-containing protein [Erysipelatoclostridium sp. MSK.7.34]|uniref:cytochrome c biogenesis protein/redoxin n=1 Tax=Erysipelatoclostridium sp. MSK.7.34 TaxID=2849178 RepID=UPI001C25DB8D|nr:cytochrome c biogenesis protein/redoxin [Erysipelatoclostridium sp. MSK.7.34]MBU9078059.1 redoxin domain-containing protein [Erysipelatoclostridium sp. MSK.7.34]